MKINFKLKILFLLLVVGYSFSLHLVSSASTISLVPDKEIVGLEEEFYIDVLLDTESQSVNGIEGTIVFDNQFISLVRIEEGKSMVSLWVEKPTIIEDRQIKFAGIMPNGYDGLIDPFNPKQKLPGPILRLVFKGLKSGPAKFFSLPGVVTLNDGQGTLENYDSSNILVRVDNFVRSFKYESPDDIRPAIDYQIIRDPNLYNNKYTLIFRTFDKETGIEKVLIKEGRRQWAEIESPYLLKDQGRHSLISLIAVNHSGASIVKTIEPLPYDLFRIINPWIGAFIILGLIIIVLGYYLIKKRNKKQLKDLTTIAGNNSPVILSPESKDAEAEEK